MNTTPDPELSQAGQIPRNAAPVAARTTAGTDAVAYTCAGCGRVLRTGRKWLGRVEACPYCQVRNDIGAAGESAETRPPSHPQRTAANALICGLLAMVLGFVGLFFRRYLGEFATLAALGLGVFSPILSIRARGELLDRQADFPAHSLDREKVLFRAGFALVFGLIGAALGALSLVLAVVSMHFS